MDQLTFDNIVRWALMAAGLVASLLLVAFDMVKGTVSRYRDLRDWMDEDRIARQDARRRLTRARGRD